MRLSRLAITAVSGSRLRSPRVLDGPLTPIVPSQKANRRWDDLEKGSEAQRETGSGNHGGRHIWYAKDQGLLDDIKEPYRADRAINWPGMFSLSRDVAK